MNKKYLIITILLGLAGLIVYNLSFARKELRVENLQKVGAGRYRATVINNSPSSIRPHINLSISEMFKSQEQQFSFAVAPIKANEAKDIEFTVEQPQKTLSVKNITVFLVTSQTTLSQSITDVSLPNNQFAGFLAISPLVFGVGLLVISRLV